MYRNQDELIEWCKTEAIKTRFTMMIEKSDKGKNNRKQHGGPRIQTALGRKLELFLDFRGA
jgi:hypothetical protein